LCCKYNTQNDENKTDFAYEDDYGAGTYLVKIVANDNAKNSTEDIEYNCSINLSFTLGEP